MRANDWHHSFADERHFDGALTITPVPQFPGILFPPFNNFIHTHVHAVLQCFNVVGFWLSFPRNTCPPQRAISSSFTRRARLEFWCCRLKRFKRLPPAFAKVRKHRIILKGSPRRRCFLLLVRVVEVLVSEASHADPTLYCKLLDDTGFKLGDVKVFVESERLRKGGCLPIKGQRCTFCLGVIVVQFGDTVTLFISFRNRGVTGHA